MNSLPSAKTSSSSQQETAVATDPALDTTATSEDTVGQAIAAMALNDLKSSSLPAAFGGQPPAQSAVPEGEALPSTNSAPAHHGWDEVAKAVHGVAALVSAIAPALGPLSVPAEIASAVIKKNT